MSPVPYTWGPFSAKIFLKIWFCKIDPLLPPHIDFNTIPYFTYGYPYRGVKEGKLKTKNKKTKKCCYLEWRTRGGEFTCVCVGGGWGKTVCLTLLFFLYTKIQQFIIFFLLSPKKKN